MNSNNLGQVTVQNILSAFNSAGAGPLANQFLSSLAGNMTFPISTVVSALQSSGLNLNSTQIMNIQQALQKTSGGGILPIGTSNPSGPVNSSSNGSMGSMISRLAGTGNGSANGSRNGGASNWWNNQNGGQSQAGSLSQLGTGNGGGSLSQVVSAAGPSGQWWTGNGTSAGNQGWAQSLSTVGATNGSSNSSSNGSSNGFSNGSQPSQPLQPIQPSQPLQPGQFNQPSTGEGWVVIMDSTTFIQLAQSGAMNLGGSQ